MIALRFALFIVLYVVVGVIVLLAMKRLFVSKKWVELMPREQDAAALAFFAVAFWPVTASIFIIWLLLRGLWLYFGFLFSMNMVGGKGVKVEELQERYRALMATDPSKEDLAAFCEENLGVTAEGTTEVTAEDTAEVKPSAKIEEVSAP